MSGGETAVVKIRDVLLVVVPAEPVDTAVAHLQEDILTAMQRHEVRGLILDLSVVEIVDSFFARMITETAQMVALMGGRTVIAGMRAPVAITVTQLGLSIGGTETALAVDEALDLLSVELSRGGR